VLRIADVPNGVRHDGAGEADSRRRQALNGLHHGVRGLLAHQFLVAAGHAAIGAGGVGGRMGVDGAHGHHHVLAPQLFQGPGTDGLHIALEIGDEVQGDEGECGLVVAERETAGVDVVVDARGLAMAPGQEHRSVSGQEEFPPRGDDALGGAGLQRWHACTS
jgi:hypothetical protein